LNYLGKDRQGLVHLAYPHSIYQEDYESLIDATLCGEANYMEEQPAGTLVTCLQCIAEQGRVAGVTAGACS